MLKENKKNIHVILIENGIRECNNEMSFSVRLFLFEEK